MRQYRNRFLLERRPYQAHQRRTWRHEIRRMRSKNAYDAYRVHPALVLRVVMVIRRRVKAKSGICALLGSGFQEILFPGHHESESWNVFQTEVHHVSGMLRTAVVLATHKAARQVESLIASDTQERQSDSQQAGSANVERKKHVVLTTQVHSLVLVGLRQSLCYVYAVPADYD